ncbi:MAG: hypothetical protein OHK93_006663 [Ramalina farinacea]|uniref:Uncharacterized protein n=1 Tax=Ramalina farinacea TaxID=258253 RepID=A0AA43TTQ9_9LECA|nr:hypothetical protein [Ramalina farinacea]
MSTGTLGPYAEGLDFLDCPGYSEGLDLVLRNQNCVAKAGVDRRQRHGQSRAQSPDVPSYTSHCLHNPLADQEHEQALCFFLSSWVDYTSDPSAERGILEVLPSLYPNTTIGSPLWLSVAAFTRLQFNKFERGVSRGESLTIKQLYGLALAATSRALQDPVELLTDETLMAVCLLGYYEAAVESFKARISSPRHFNGAAALIRRRQGMLTTRSGQRMLTGVRSNLVHRAVQSASPIDVSEDIWANSAVLMNTPAIILDRILVDVANLLALARQHLPPGSAIATPKDPHNARQSSSLLPEAEVLERRLMSWAKALPSHWSPAKVSIDQVPASVTSAGFYGKSCDIYQDIMTCATWNDWRTARLKVLAIIASHKPGPERATVSTKIQEIADDICASIPFSLGSRTTPAPLHDTKNISYPTLPGTAETPEVHYRTAAAYGGWYLFPPMKQVMAVGAYLREGQMLWMALQLRRLASVYNICPED